MRQLEHQPISKCNKGDFKFGMPSGALLRFLVHNCVKLLSTGVICYGAIARGRELLA